MSVASAQPLPVEKRRLQERREPYPDECGQLSARDLRQGVDGAIFGGQTGQLGTTPDAFETSREPVVRLERERF